ncbi:hypothetical protein [Parasphingorhabdus sp.]|uniref:hypothetical protein n=1 Tax=Parasphingorhabdus sp. TaxID=2709688 RepID=UPI003263C136
MLKIFFIWIAAISIATISGATAMGAIAKAKSPELALSLSPQNGFAAQAMVSNVTMIAVIEKQGSFPDSIDPAWSAMAVQAFQSEAVSPDAIAVIALSRTGYVRRKLMEKAFELSRRRKTVIGWLIADSGNRDELTNLLNYYDTLLRSSSSANSVVMPAMASALADHSAIAPLASLLSKKPPWAFRFWRQVSSTPQATRNAVQLRQRLYRPGELTDDYSDPSLIGALVRGEQYREANELHSLLSNGSSSSSLIKNGSFSYEPKYPPLDWQLFSTGEYGAVATDGSLQISAIANSGGLFARQLVRFPSAVLQIDTKFASEIPEDANLELRISCAETIAIAPVPVRLPLTDQSEHKQISNESSGCSYFWFDIVGRASEKGDGFDTVLESVSLHPK